MRLWDLGAQQSCDRCGSAFVLSYPPFVCPVLQSVLAILLTTLLLYYLLLTTYYTCLCFVLSPQNARVSGRHIL